MNKPSFQPKKVYKNLGNQFQKNFKFDTVRVYYKTKPVKKMLKTSNFQIFWKYAITQLNTHESALSLQKRSEFPIYEIRRKNFENQWFQYLWKCLSFYTNEKKYVQNRFITLQQ